jgi:hypothetical protein
MNDLRHNVDCMAASRPSQQFALASQVAWLEKSLTVSTDSYRPLADGGKQFGCPIGKRAHRRREKAAMRVK